MYKPPFQITSLMIDRLTSISFNLGKISNFESLERMPLLRKNNQIKSIHSSLKIEANSLSLNEVKDVIRGVNVIGDKVEILEVKNAYEAYKNIDTFDPYSINDLLKAHKILLNGINEDAGKFRNHNEGVTDGKVLIHLAPPPNNISFLMDELFEWLKNDLETNILIKSCVFHYEFVFIHPFSDGNGRVARLYQNVILSKRNKLFLYFPIESKIEKYQSEYYEAIDKSNKEGSSTYFIEFTLKMIDETIKETINDINKESKYISSNVNKLLDVLDFEIPLSAKEIMEALKIKSRETLRNTYLNPAIKNGLVKMTLPDKPNSKNQKYYK